MAGQQQKMVIFVSLPNFGEEFAMCNEKRTHQLFQNLHMGSVEQLHVLTFFPRGQHLTLTQSILHQGLINREQGMHRTFTAKLKDGAIK